MDRLLTLDDFVPALGSDFVLTAQDGTSTALRLVLAQPLGPAHDGGRAPFVLGFHGAPDVLLPQATYPLVNEHVGVQAIFLVPQARTETATEYEAVFS